MTTSPTQRRPLAARLALVSTVSLGLVAGPLALAGPASAAGYTPPRHDNDNCRVVAYKPYGIYGNYRNHTKKLEKVVFKFKIHCDERTRVYYDHRMFQKDGRWDKEIRDRHRHGSKVVRGDEWVTKVVDVKNDNHRERDIKVVHVVKIVFKDKDNHHRWVWKSDTDRAHDKIDLVKRY